MVSSVYNAGATCCANAQQTASKSAERLSQNIRQNDRLVEDVVQLKEAKHMNQVGVTMLRAADQMLGTLIDLKA